MSKKLRILVLIDKALIPPSEAKKHILDKAPWRTEFYVISTLRSLGHDVKVLGVEGDLKVIRLAKENFDPHIAFNLLEEFDGECVFDHNVVSYLELIRLPYTGCNPKGLMLSRDKALFKKILYYHRIRTPKFAVAKRGKNFRKPRNLQYPLFVKSLTDEGSAGISQNSIVDSDQKLLERIDFIHSSNQSDAIVETYIEGKELYVSLMGNSKISVFPLLELEFKKADSIHQIATSKVKWNPNYRKKYSIDIKIQDKLDEQTLNKIKTYSKRIYKLLGLSGYARLDLRLTDNNDIYFLEANPNPDIAKEDEFAYSAKKAGYNYPELLNKLISLGLSFSPHNTYR